MLSLQEMVGKTIVMVEQGERPLDHMQFQRLVFHDGTSFYVWFEAGKGIIGRHAPAPKKGVSA